MRGLIIGLLVMASVFAAPRSADACSYGPLEPHVVDENEKAVDTTPPSAIGKTTYTIERGHGPESAGCGSSVSDSCADIGALAVHLGEATDDRTDAAQMGYRIEVVAGSAPSDSTWPTSPVRAYEGRTLYFHWVDGEGDEQEAIDFTFRVRAVDRAGNEGPPTDVRIRDAGSSEGCRVASGSFDLSWVSIGLLLLALRRFTSFSRWVEPRRCGPRRRRETQPATR